MTTTRNYIPYRSFDPAEITFALGPGLIQSLTDVREPTTDSTSSPVPGQTRDRVRQQRPRLFDPPAKDRAAIWAYCASAWERCSAKASYRQ